MPRYFFGENAGRPIRAGGRDHAFEIIGLAGGTHQGVLAVPDAELEPFLAVAARWVEEITAEDYAAYLEKKKAGDRSRPTPDLPPPPRRGPALVGAGAAVVDGRDVNQPVKEELPDKIDEAVAVGRGDAIPDSTPTKPSTRRPNHREKRGTASP